MFIRILYHFELFGPPCDMWTLLADSAVRQGAQPRRDMGYISAPRSGTARKWVPAGPVTQILGSAEPIVTVTNILLLFQPPPPV